MVLKVLAFAAMILLPGAAWSAGSVTLTTLDGLRSIEGQLLSFDGEYFRVETEFGPLTLDSGDVTCAGEGCPEADALVAKARFGGSADMIHRLMPPLLTRFAERQGLAFRMIYLNDETVLWELRARADGRVAARIDGLVLPEQEALARLAEGELDVSLGRMPGGPEVTRDVIALDALVPIVSLDHPHTTLGIERFEGILSGRVRSWDSPDMPIALHLPAGRDVAPSLRRVFPDLRFGLATRHDNPQALATAVSADPAALGLSPLSIIGNTVPLVIGGRCGLATLATRATVKAEDYPLTEPFFLHRKGARQPRLVRDFIAFARSRAAQPVVAASGFIDQAIGRITFDRQGSRLANAFALAEEDPERLAAVQRMVEALQDAERLTLTFRFQDGSSDLDAQSQSNIRRLSEAITRGDFAGREIVFAGFTDGEGRADANMRLSERRATAVRRAVSVYLGDADARLSVEGFGELLPMACDDTAWGRQVNRRVEVWLRPLRDQPDR